MYAGVPSTKPASVEYVRVPLSIFAMPKSVIFRSPSSVISALPGLTSRWSTSRSCAYWRAAHMATVAATADCGSMVRAWVARVPPPSRSITSRYRLSCSTKS